MGVSEGMIGLDNEEVEAQEMRNFSDDPPKILRFEEGKTFRVHFFSRDVLMRRRHFQEEEKKYYRCLDHVGYCPICVASSKKMRGCKRASDSFGANVLVYDADDAGEILDVLSADVHFWAFGSDKFAQLRKIMKEYGDITQLDILVKCVDQNYQQMEITVADTCYYLADEDFKVECDAKIESDCYPVDKFLCRETSIVEICEVFGLNVEDFVPAAILDRIAGVGGSGSPRKSSGDEELPFSGGTPRGSQVTQEADEEPNFQSIDNIANLV